MARGRFGEFDKTPVTSLYTTITGTDKEAEELLKKGAEYVLIARVKAGKVTFVVTDVTDDGEALTMQRQQVAVVQKHVLATRDMLPGKLFDQIIDAIEKHRPVMKGQLTVEEQLEGESE